MLKKKKYGLLIIFFTLTVFLTSQFIIMFAHAQEKFISAKDAASHVGEVQTVCGVVASTKYHTKGKGQPTFLNLDQPYPHQIFIILIWGSDRGKFPEPPEDLYMGKKICVKGMIKAYRGKPEIIVNDPSQITIVPSQ
jgi:DNA/RNA endonuclease YhcR with UshA esterase domain